MSTGQPKSLHGRQRLSGRASSPLIFVFTQNIEGLDLSFGVLAKNNFVDPIHLALYSSLYRRVESLSLVRPSAQLVDREATRCELQRLLLTAGTGDKKQKVKQALDHLEVTLVHNVDHHLIVSALRDQNHSKAVVFDEVRHLSNPFAERVCLFVKLTE